MPFSGTGTFSPYTPGNPAVTGTTISSTAFNNTVADIATGLSTAMTRDGQSPATNNIPLGGFKLTGVAAATMSGDALAYGTAPSFGVVFTPAGTGAVASTVQTKLRENVSIKDFGAICDGVTDDTTAINSAITACTAGSTLHIQGTPLISSTIVVAKGLKILFDGGKANVANVGPGSYLLKKSTMTTDALQLNAQNIVVEGGGVLYQSGATGDGIHIQSNGIVLRDVSVIGVSKATASGNGIRVGSDVAAYNCNSWQFDNCVVAGMSGHGFYIHALAGTAPDVNGGNAVGCFGNSNGGDGFLIDNAALNTFTGCLGEGNTGNGMTIGNDNRPSSTNNGNYNNVVIGGDYEANTAGQLVVKKSAISPVICLPNRGVVVTDNGFLTKRIDQGQSARIAYTPGLIGSTGAEISVANVTVSGSTATITATGHTYANGDYVYHRAFGTVDGNQNLNGVFLVSGVAANTYNITVREDVYVFLPKTSSTEVGFSRKCGTYSVANGHYEYDQNSVTFEAHITTTAIGNITGSVQFILPAPPVSLNGGGSAVIGQCSISYYTGITHTGQLSATIFQNGVLNQNIYHNVGSALTPGQLQNTGLAAATDIYIAGRYYYQ